ncbi:DUF6461 domain-containing protein [Spongiactinospora sp. TRM90649]|uniref:DUF6461 domain-containing protein n=1 Tax=Spongiactinospora sp. TRM90649 TaxID=3031114 RepID=UPI0023F73CDA|nr:DUF6461 domain-containing protein [Spongiactinospora sp. TRM90649]MDF5751805.1 DUF6461 domain-containing protein [Spongiactinospora sp. TRM90649]
MIIKPPDDYAWFANSALAEAYSFIFVRGFTPEQLVARLGGRVEDFSWKALDEVIDVGGPYDRGFEFVGIAALGEWAFVVQYNSSLGTYDDFLTPQSAGTRLISLYRLDLKGLEEFRWIEDGETRFAFWAQEGYSEKVPGELVETMERIHRDYGRFAYELYWGPGLILIEHLTGIELTPQILEGATYLSGTIRQPFTD